MRKHDLAALLMAAALLTACETTEPPVPTTVELVSGNGQTAPVTTTLAPLTLRLLDQNRRGVAGVAVTWLAAAGTISGDATTNSNGEARASWVLPTTAGPLTASAQAGSLTAAFTATALAGPPTQVSTEGDGQNAPSAGLLPDRLVIKLADSYGNGVSTDVSWNVISGGGRLESVQTRSDATGRATAAWLLGATVDTQLVRVRAGTITRDFRATVRIHRFGLVPGTANLVLTSTLRPGLLFEDLTGTVLAGSATLTSSNASVVDIANGVLVPRAPGSATVTARAGALTATLPVTVGVFPTAARGSVVTADSSSASLVAQLRTQGAIYTFPFTANSFSMAGPTPAAASQVVIDAPTGSARTYFPAVIGVSATSYSTAVLNTLLIPRSWRVRAGTHAGQTLPVSLLTAFEPPCSDTSNANCQGYFPAYWSVDPKVWPTSALPIPVAIHRGASTSAWAVTDSAALWQVLDNMNRDYGTALFRPARVEEFTVTTDNYANGAILVYIDQSLVAQGYGGYTNWSWNGRGELFRARVRLASLGHLNSSSLVTHEFLHALGHSHTCKWSSVMGGYGCGSAPRLTPNDVVYAHLAQRIKQMRVAHGTPYGIAEAMLGEQLMSSDPLIALRTDLEQLFIHGRALSARGSDGAS